MIGCWYCYKQPCRFIRDSRRFIVVTRFRQMSLYKRLPPPQLRSEEEQGGMVPPHSWYYRDRAGFIQNAKSTCYETNIEETFRYPIRNRQHDIVWIILYTIVLWLLWSNNKRICMLYFAFLEGSIKETNKRLYYQTGYWLLASIIKLDNTFAHLDQPGDNPWVTSRKTGVSDCMFRRLAPLRGRQQPKLAKQAYYHHHFYVFAYLYAPSKKLWSSNCRPGAVLPKCCLKTCVWGWMSQQKEYIDVDSAEAELRSLGIF